MHTDYIYLMQLESNRPSSFFKGISLSQYMKDMNCPEQAEQMEETNYQNNDLYLLCQPQPNIAHCAIKQIDEDNYDQSADHQDLIVQPLHNFDLQRGRVIHPEDLKGKLKVHQFKLMEIRRSKHQSKSPMKENPSTKKEMFRSLYGHNFNTQPKQEHGQLLSTLGISNWGGKHRSLNKKQVQTRDKNRRQYQQIIKYESVVNQRLDLKLNRIRIDGIKDKIHDRNERFGKNRFA